MPPTRARHGCGYHRRRPAGALPMPARLSRRDFLKCSVVAGISVYIAAPGSAALAALFEEQRQRPLPWDARSGRIRYRTDATAKVTGEKVFGFDMRGRDLPHWPQQQAHAMLLRVTRADRVYAGFDLSLLGDDLQARPHRHRRRPGARRRALPAVLRRRHAAAAGQDAGLSRPCGRAADLARLRALPLRQDRTASSATT